MTENVKVAVRVRPFNSRELARNANIIIGMSGSQTEIKDPENIKAEGKKFAFDYSYWSHDSYTEGSDGYLSPKDSKYADQKKVFNDLGKGVLDNAWKGYNCSLFAYGQTGSGKSYSMVGYGSNKGIVPMVCEDLFKGIDEKRKTAPKDDDFTVTLSMLEIYNEQVRDLLSKKPPAKGGLKVRQHPSKGFYVETLTSASVSSYSQIENKVNEGTRSRTVASTNMNATSSRAHTIIAINFAQKQKNDAGQNMTKTSIINLVDLAGSERADSTGATGDRLKEGSAINQSLSMLGNCIKALADISSGKKKVVVPFRDSALTKLLQNALGGNSKTIMIAALSPADINYEETLSTLRFADRAKAIKTSAVINESPTDKLIRELREENAKLMEMLKGGGVAAGAVVAGAAASSNEVDDLKKELEEQMAANQRELEEMKKSWQERMTDSQKESKSGMEEEVKLEKERKVIPHLWNLNEDPALTAMIIHFCKEGTSKIGNKNASPAPQILMNGLSIQKDHATMTNKKGAVVLKPSVGAKILVNGKKIQGEVSLHHNDRLLFGSTHLYVFHHPQDEAKLVKSGNKQDQPTYGTAQEEIAKESGIMQESSGKSKEDLILQEELISLLPMVGEANAMSEELDKKVKFEITLISALARGLKEGPVEIKVKMKNLENGNWWMFDRNNFINRKYMMQDLYQNYMDGDKDWDVPKDRDPFWEPHTTPVMIGTVSVFLQTIPYLIEMDDKLNIMDVKGTEVGKLDVKLLPCDDKGNTLSEDVFIDEPKEWLKNKKTLSFKFHIQEMLGIPANFDTMYCQYKFFVDEKPTISVEIKQKAHANLNYQRKFDYKVVTQQFLDYCESEMLLIEVWGKQKEEGLKTSQKSELKTKDLMQKEKSTLGAMTPTKGSPSPKPGAASANNVQLANQIQEQVKKAKAKGMKSVPIEEIEETLARLTGVPQPNAKATKGGKSTSRACVLQ